MTSTTVSTATSLALQKCVMPGCGATYDVGEVRTACGECGALLDITYDWDRLETPSRLRDFEKKWARRNEPLERSGVWRFRELLPFAPDDQIVTIGEGQTPLHASASVDEFIGLRPDRVRLQYEGMNPSGSFKDNGMTAAFTHAHMIGAEAGRLRVDRQHLRVARPVLRHEPADAGGHLHRLGQDQLRQALAGARLRRAHRADRRRLRRRDAARPRGLVKQLGIYLVNSVNPFRLEGQKTIMLRVLESLELGGPRLDLRAGRQPGQQQLVRQGVPRAEETRPDRPQVPRLAIINAAGANTLHELYEKRGLRWNGGRPDTTIIDSYYAELDAAASGPTRSPARSRSTGR